MSIYKNLFVNIRGKNKIMKKIMSSIESFKSKSCLEIHKGIASDTTFARGCHGIQSDKLIHEHNFLFQKQSKKEIVLFNVLLAARIFDDKCQNSNDKD
jgi:hypothetical protein